MKYEVKFTNQFKRDFCLVDGTNTILYASTTVSLS